MSIIVDADIVSYFQLLDEKNQMSRNEKSALLQRGRVLKRNAMENCQLRDEWNLAAVETNHKEKMFKVSQG